ncbi:hypothetical protein [Actinacidiphila sp. ITFR-21]|uniref:hypothetical protein n=1 Tax=Actinacidiphila sp. ITFR-21 TaxID=3075199 RepID=UPI00288A639A|nr:hypothetical protein [Streptomyces sp. ITFR-21]WNI20278.1 hypothetical protein RLT57_32955 [Streptomyces sp. ITFR-21]
MSCCDERHCECVVIAGPGATVDGDGSTTDPYVIGATGGQPAFEHGSAALAGSLNLTPTASGAWTSTTLQITLPAAGTYQLDAAVRASLLTGSPADHFISARLYDETAGTPVPHSTVMVLQLSPPNAAANGNTHTTGTAPIAVEYSVTGPATIRLQGARTVVAGTGTQSASITTDANGGTTLRYRRIA